MWKVWQNYDLKQSVMAQGRLEKNCRRILLIPPRQKKNTLSLVVSKTINIYLRRHSVRKSSKGSTVQGEEEGVHNKFPFK
jgi:hypothetical protein